MPAFKTRQTIRRFLFLLLNIMGDIHPIRLQIKAGLSKELLLQGVYYGEISGGMR